MDSSDDGLLDAPVQTALSQISHELRTPLSAMLGYLDEATARTQDPTVLEPLVIVRSQGEYLLRLIESVLDYSRIQSGKYSLVFKPFLAGAVASEVVQMLKESARQKGLELIAHGDGMDTELVGDQDRLRQVLVNLTGNAIKFTESGKVEIHVRNLEWGGEPSVAFEVRDEGIGIPRPLLSKVFRPFEQADESISSRFGGTGLGLAISREIVLQMGGDVEVESEPGRGSTFRVVVPVEAKAQAVCEWPVRPSGREEDESATLRLDARVLVAEDDPVQGKLLERMFQACGCEVEWVGDGPGASRALLAAQASGQMPDLVLLDLNLPGKDGCAVARDCRVNGYDGAVVAMTASASSADRARAQVAGFDEILAKPLRRSEIYDLLMRWVDPEAARSAS
ncbi:MAG: response regulator [Candidatus Eisenbacteria bacterium]|uniref:histidine kinase n=1 Tax=Eiseniibacteriota bacterium TaxID=2212470 RepID=A0A956NEA1_UNCEI|nr:response regulator [Candidatus Eisenbacteria bacterium]MCB9466289.1 response regulator [Candidatus Eisenbacteria bacterium]